MTWNTEIIFIEASSIIYTLGKGPFAAATFKGLRDVSFSDRVRKQAVFLGLCESSLHFLLREKVQTNNIHGK